MVMAWCAMLTATFIFGTGMADFNLDQPDRVLDEDSAVRSAPDLITDEAEAWRWAMENNLQAVNVYEQNSVTLWQYHANLTEENQRKSAMSQYAYADYWRVTSANASRYDWRNFQNATLKRLFAKLSIRGLSALTSAKIHQFGTLGARLKEIYGTGKACRANGECLRLDPGLTRLFHVSRDWNELQWAWQTWRDNTGKHMKDIYRRFTTIQNEAAVLSGLKDMGDNWRSSYEVDDFEALVMSLWEEVKPLYEQLHAYTLRKLKKYYRKKPFPETGQIPAHILGDMWSQQWANIMDIVRPYPDVEPANITKALLDQGFSVRQLFELTEEFYTSMGFPPLPASFWKGSILERLQDGRDMMCHPSAWDFYNGKDFRIMQCTDVNEEYLYISHHEMGHIYYFMEYRQQPVHFRDGPNAGFHEAIGDLIALSVSTPEHLYKVGILTPTHQTQTPEMEIESLLSRALAKIPGMPFSLLLDLWRWRLFAGNITHEHYNTKWWEFRCKYQGVSPPVTRSERDFDPGAKFHLAADIPSIRYFISSILEFQFHEGLCRLANHSGPLHKCDIYQSKTAGTKLRDMLRLGRSVTWPEALEIVTGSTQMDARPLREFFRPLEEWLRKENGNYTTGWDPMCPPGTLSSRSISILKNNNTNKLLINFALFITCTVTIFNTRSDYGVTGYI